jgi:hypothetical protein
MVDKQGPVSSSGRGWDSTKLPEPIVPGWYSSTQVQGILQCSRQHVHAIARREGWQPRKTGAIHLYQVSDVAAYLPISLRVKLARSIGFHVKLTGPEGSFPRTDSFDTLCPTCSGFAIEIINKGWICENGHRGSAPSGSK